MVRLVKTMTQYYVTVALWFLTIAGGIYKTFEYYCVPYIVAENPEEIQPIYKLENFTITGSSFDLRDQYGIWDIITMFFVFSFMGWIWEVMLHVARDHVLVNRGFMYGP